MASTSKAKLAHTRAWDLGWLSGCLALASWLYFSTITRFSIWHDESFTTMLINYDWGELLRRAALDVHPPLYYLILKLWTSVFGTSLLAIRSLSAFCMLGLIVVAYYFVKHLWDVRAARVASAFVVVAPFIVRYAQEARMYALVALLLLGATYLLVLAVERSDARRLYLYALLMALAIYCHYYALFLLPVQWLYVLLHTRRKQPKGSISLKSWHWWFANGLIVLLLAPWSPTAFWQFTSIQGAFWIPKVSANTVFSTFTNFMLYKDPSGLNWLLKLWMYTVAGGLVVLVTLSIGLDRLKRLNTVLVASYAFMAPLLIFLLSLPPFQPIYNNRYFALTCVAFYTLLGVLLFCRPLSRFRFVQVVLAVAIFVTLCAGTYNLRQTGNYNPDRKESYSMGQLSHFINQNYQAGDAIVSTNLSTYFDINYYNRTGSPVYLKVGERPSGTGNTSLIYDRDDLLLFSYQQLPTGTKRVWLVTDAYDQTPEVPGNWQAVAKQQQDYASITEYIVTP